MCPWMRSACIETAFAHSLAALKYLGFGCGAASGGQLGWRWRIPSGKRLGRNDDCPSVRSPCQLEGHLNRGDSFRCGPKEKLASFHRFLAPTVRPSHFEAVKRRPWELGHLCGHFRYNC